MDLTHLCPPSCTLTTTRVLQRAWRCYQRYTFSSCRKFCGHSFGCRLDGWSVASGWRHLSPSEAIRDSPEIVLPTRQKTSFISCRTWTHEHCTPIRCEQSMCLLSCNLLSVLHMSLYVKLYHRHQVCTKVFVQVTTYTWKVYSEYSVFRFRPDWTVCLLQQNLESIMWKKMWKNRKTLCSNKDWYLRPVLILILRPKRTILEKKCLFLVTASLL